MQSWGYQSRFGRRTTLAYPTRSGLLGMLCAAMGVPRSDRSTLQTLTQLDLEVLGLTDVGIWTDYHTVGGGYAADVDRAAIPRTADGKPKVNVTQREFLANARFGALLCGDRQLLDSCDGALKDPVWGVWFGRKCCIPSSPISQGIFPSREQAVLHLEGLCGGTARRRIAEVARFEDGTDTLRDVPMDFGTRVYEVRRVAVENF